MKKVTDNTINKESGTTDIPFSNNLLLKIALLIFGLVFLISSANSQNIRRSNQALSFGIENLSPANGHGMFYSPNLTIRSNKNYFGIGITVQQNSKETNGFNFQYSRNLSGRENSFLKDIENEITDLIQINCYSALQYNSKALLGRNLAREEQLIRRDNTTLISQLRFSTVQLSSGIELQINFSRKISWKSRIGAATYYHFNYFEGLDHQRIAPVLNIGTGIHFNF
jgi:hypothetical protein